MKTATEVDDAALELDEDERDLVKLEVDALLPALVGERHARYAALGEAADEGMVPGALVPQLQSLLELALQTARARKLYRAEGEKVLTGLFKRTPGGRELTARLGEINKALRAVAGHELTSARVGMRTLGHFTVTLRTDTATLTLALRPDGINVDSVAVGPGS